MQSLKTSPFDELTRLIHPERMVEIVTHLTQEEEYLLVSQGYTPFERGKIQGYIVGTDNGVFPSGYIIAL